jgi:catechol 2,3-dioxygenase-like lactoylglutathione lyase family enzyme
VSFDLLGFSHIGFAVRSIEEFQATWGIVLGIRDWVVHDESAPAGIQLHGADVGALAVRVGFARLAGTSIELIETVAGRTHHLEHLDRTGVGLHHVAFWVADLERELAKAEPMGLEIVMSPSSLRPDLRGRPVSAVMSGSAASVEIPKFFAHLVPETAECRFTLELLDARFADDYRRLNGPMPYYPGELDTTLPA